MQNMLAEVDLIMNEIGVKSRAGQAPQALGNNAAAAQEKQTLEKQKQQAPAKL